MSLLFHLTGGIFEKGSGGTKSAFMQAIDEVNSGTLIAPHNLQAHVADLGTSEKQTLLSAILKLEAGKVIAVFGPQSSEGLTAVRNATQSLGIPHLEAHVEVQPFQYSINLAPDYVVFARAFADLMIEGGWNSFAVVYEEEDAKTLIEEINSHHGLSQKVASSDLITRDNMRQIWRQIKGQGTRHIFIGVYWMSSLMESLMQAAAEEGMLSQDYEFVLLALDAEAYAGLPARARVTSFSILGDPEHPYDLQSALTCDAVELLAVSLSHLLHEEKQEGQGDASAVSSHSILMRDLRQRMLKTELIGRTGVVELDEKGIRSKFNLRVVQTVENQVAEDMKRFKTIGTWCPDRGLKMNL